MGPVNLAEEIVVLQRLLGLERADLIFDRVDVPSKLCAVLVPHPKRPDIRVELAAAQHVGMVMCLEGVPSGPGGRTLRAF